MVDGVPCSHWTTLSLHGNAFLGSVGKQLEPVGGGGRLGLPLGKCCVSQSPVVWKAGGIIMTLNTLLGLVCSEGNPLQPPDSTVSTWILGKDYSDSSEVLHSDTSHGTYWYVHFGL